jgi:hypothetical protein
MAEPVVDLGSFPVDRHCQLPSAALPLGRHCRPHRTGTAAQTTPALPVLLMPDLRQLLLLYLEHVIHHALLVLFSLF